MTMSIVVISLLLLLSHVVEAQSAVFDVTKYGAKGNGNADISQALLSAWKDACASTTPSTLVIPKGTFLLNEVAIKGPCKAPVDFQLQGTLKADPKRNKADGWLTFGYIDRLTISGGGTFDGQGAVAWSMNDCSTNKNCPILAVSLRFNFVTNSLFHDVTSLDSKNFHVTLTGCKNLTFQHFTITAPETSINTDGIHIGYSTEITIIDSNIKTGDDCVSIGDGAKNINIERVTCGPGHGFSVGSLGKSTKVEVVEGIFVKNCTLTKTMNGVRIKTWPSSPTDGFASDMHFEDIIMNNVGNPILIDQEYCPSNLCSLKSPSKVKISKVSFKNIRGTSATPVAVKLVCSKSVPCENVEVGNIDLTYTGRGGPATSQCKNIQPKLTGKQNPPPCVGSSQSS